LTILQTAKPHHAQALYRRPSVPGSGQIVRLVRLDEMHDLTRFPRVQEVVSSGRLVTWAKASAGTRSGTSGAQMGHADRQWAVSEAAVLCLRHNPPGPPSRARWEHTQGKGNALTSVAHQLARAVSDSLTRATGCDRQKCLHGSWSGASEPHASLDAHGRRLVGGALRISLRGNAEEHSGAFAPLPWPLLGPPLRLVTYGAGHARFMCAAPPPPLDLTGQRTAWRHSLA
jgi:hypothetical protein